jgi:hypothetical protein
MQVEGIAWHGVTLEPDQFTAMKKLCREVFGLTPVIEQDGWTLFPMQNGTILDLFEPGSELIPAYDLNDGIVFGFPRRRHRGRVRRTQSGGLRALVRRSSHP